MKNKSMFSKDKKERIETFFGGQWILLQNNNFTIAGILRTPPWCPTIKSLEIETNWIWDLKVNLAHNNKYIMCTQQYDYIFQENNLLYTECFKNNNK